MQRYRQRISGPLLDRIDIHIEVPQVEFRELSRAEAGESSAAILRRIEQARAAQAARFAGERRVACNAAMTPKLLKQHARLDEESRHMLEQAMDQMDFSARAHDRILKVARTLADLAGADAIDPNHILEAVNYRTLDRTLWA